VVATGQLTAAAPEVSVTSPVGMVVQMSASPRRHWYVTAVEVDAPALDRTTLPALSLDPWIGFGLSS
jgi:hypothetical protein